MMRFCSLGQTILGSLSRKRLGISRFRGCFLLANQLHLDRRSNFSERLRVRSLTLLNLDDVIAKLGVNQRRIANLLGEDSVVELRHHGSATGKAEIAAL